MENTLIIENPLIFMNNKYIKKKVLIDEFKTGEQKIFFNYDIPISILITFKDNPSLIEKFISKYNDSFFEENYNYKLKISKFTSTPESEEEKVKKIQETENLKPIKYDIEYEKQLETDYENSLYANGLIYKNEEGKQVMYEGIKWLIKKFGANLIQGKSVLTISLPVILFDKRTLHECLAYEIRAAPYFLTHASYCNDSFERLKWVTCFLISTCPIDLIQIKPFNPIIGETFQCRIGNMDFYVEHTRNHPITANFYGISDDKIYKIYGYMMTEASIGANTINATKLGRFFIQFKDGSKYEIRLPGVLVQGTTFGERLFNYVDKCLAIDHTNGYCSYIEMNPDAIGFFKSIFTSKQKTTPDTFKGKIVKLKDVGVNLNNCNHTIKDDATALVNIEGGWTRDCLFDGDEYWNIDDYPLLMEFDFSFILPSDGRFRSDRLEFIKGNVEKAQEEKEKLENLQRKDRKLRADYEMSVKK